MDNALLLVSHKLCPYVQRAVILLEEKGVSYTRRDIDLSNKPRWFLDASPLGKTPLLLLQGRSLFESAVICDYLDETLGPALHPDDPLERAWHRSWIEFASSILNKIAGFYSAATDEMLESKAVELERMFQKLEEILGNGPYFSGDRFSVVDAAYAPVFRYFDTFEKAVEFEFFDPAGKVARWREQLQVRKSVRNAVNPLYPQWLEQFIVDKDSALSPHFLRSARRA